MTTARRVWSWAARRRWWVLTGWTAVWTVEAMARPHGFVWHYFVAGAGELTSSRAWDLFSDHPELQTGPVSVAVVAPLVRALPARAAFEVAVVLMAASGLLALAMIERLGRPVPAGRVVAVGLVTVPVWAQVAVVWSHPDDVIAVVCTVAALLQLRRGRAVAAAVLLGVAVDAKPWALLFIPLVLLVDQPRRRAVAVAVVGLVVLAAWLPFLVVDPRSVIAADYTIPVSPQSVLHLVGVRGRTPSWCRIAQLLVGSAVTAVAVRRHRWQYALLGGVAARMLLDPAAKPYYVAGAIVAAAVVDLTGRGRPVPRWTLAVFVGLFVVPAALGGTGVDAAVAAVVRASVLIAALVAAVHPGPVTADASAVLHAPRRMSP